MPGINSSRHGPTWLRSPASLFRLGAHSIALAALMAAFGLIPWSHAQETAPVDEERSLRVWHFAEGNSRNDFQTYFSVLNLSDQPASVTAHYHRDDGIRLVQWFGVGPIRRLSFSANDTVGPRAFGASFFSDQDVVVERSTTWGPNQNAETTVGFAPNGKRTWHFAEGTTRGLVSTYFVTQNLSHQPANVTATFTMEDGSRSRRGLTLAPRAREAFRVNDLLPSTAFASSFVADQDIVVERTIMSEGPTGVLGGPGFTPAGEEPGFRTWDFAEGNTRRPYLTYFVIFNPNPEATEVRFRFRADGGSSKQHSLRVPAMARVAFDPRDVAPETSFGTSISADRPIVAERTYYSTGDGLYGALGYTPAAAPGDSRAWYFAEGNTTGKIETFFLIANLSDETATVQASYYPDDGRPIEQSLTVPAGGRISLRANDTVPDRTFSARFLADKPVWWSAPSTSRAGAASPPSAPAPAASSRPGDPRQRLSGLNRRYNWYHVLVAHSAPGGDGG